MMPLGDWPKMVFRDQPDAFKNGNALKQRSSENIGTTSLGAEWSFVIHRCLSCFFLLYARCIYILQFLICNASSVLRRTPHLSTCGWCLCSLSYMQRLLCICLSAKTSKVCRSRHLLTCGWCLCGLSLYKAALYQFKCKEFWSLLLSTSLNVRSMPRHEQRLLSTHSSAKSFSVWILAIVSYCRPILSIDIGGWRICYKVVLCAASGGWARCHHVVISWLWSWLLSKPVF